MIKTLEQWIALYDKKIPEGFKRDERFELFYLPEKGFAEVAATDKMIVVNQMCGEFRFWRGFAEKLAKKIGYSHVGTICIRNVRAYLRLAVFVPYRIEETEQGDRFFCRDKNTGQRVQASPAGKNTYYITGEVTADDV